MHVKLLSLLLDHPALELRSSARLRRVGGRHLQQRLLFALLYCQWHLLVASCGLSTRALASG